jgi:F-type H+-transporting ATPase subunit b
MRIRGKTAVLWMIFFVTLPVLASEEMATEESTPSVFEGYYGEAIWTLVWFFVLLVVLWKFAWKPLLAGLTGRQEYIEKQISDAEKTRAEAKKVLEEYGAKLADAERQGRDIISVRTKEAEKQAKEVIRQNQKDIEQMKLRVDAELERERIDAEDGLWTQAGDIVCRLGEEIFGKTLDDADNQKLIDEAIARLKSQKPE